MVFESTAINDGQKNLCAGYLFQNCHDNCKMTNKIINPNSIIPGFTSNYGLILGGGEGTGVNFSVIL